jgi:tetratricopeptide (TPR) repeat protein
MIQNNLGVVAAMKGDKKAAETFFQAGGSSREVAYNKANLAVANGKYQEALSNYGESCTFNAALAKLLAGNASAAGQTLDCSPDKDSASGNYLRAILAARSGNKESVISSLRKAIAAEPALKAKAKTDLEFRKFRTDSDFSSLIN